MYYKKLPMRSVLVKNLVTALNIIFNTDHEEAQTRANSDNSEDYSAICFKNTLTCKT